MSRSGRVVGSRTARRGYFGRLLAIVALCVQLVAPGLHGPALLSPSEQSELAALLSVHALCIAADTRQPRHQPPAKQAPEQTDEHLAACCSWHGNQGQGISKPTTLEPIAFDHAEVSLSAPAAVVGAARLPGTVRARAPPISA
jgi:hypothetical protein